MAKTRFNKIRFPILYVRFRGKFVRIDRNRMKRTGKRGGKAQSASTLGSIFLLAGVSTTSFESSFP